MDWFFWSTYAGTGKLAHFGFVNLNVLIEIFGWFLGQDFCQSMIFYIIRWSIAPKNSLVIKSVITDITARHVVTLGADKMAISFLAFWLYRVLVILFERHAVLSLLMREILSGLKDHHVRPIKSIALANQELIYAHAFTQLPGLLYATFIESKWNVLPCGLYWTVHADRYGILDGGPMAIDPILVEIVRQAIYAENHMISTI